MSATVPDDPPLSAPIDADRPPPFHEMNTYPQRFERLTAEVLNLEPDLHRAALFGPSGEGQFGIDVTAELVAGPGLDAASCKCQGQVQPHEWKAWSDAFLDHWETQWKDRGVRRFIVVVAAEKIDTVRHRRARDAEAERFTALGVDYVVWGPHELDQRLRQDRALVRRRLGKVWADILCGPDPAEAALAGALERAQAVALHGAQQSVADLARNRIAAAVEDLHCGDRERVVAAAAGLRQPQTWLQLPPELQAGVARLQGSAALQAEDRAAARAFCDEALALDPQSRRLAAALCDSPDGSLTALGSPVTLEDRQAHAMYLLGAGRDEAAGPALEALEREAPDNPETQRLLAYWRLLRDERAAAFTAVQAAEAKAPLRLAILRMGALVRYALAMSPMVELARLVRPHPTPALLIRADDESRAHLATARELMGKAAARSTSLEDRRWLVAINCALGDDRAAGDIAQGILAQAPGDAIAAGWALMNGLAFNRPAARAAMCGALEAGRLEANDLHALLWLLVEEGTPAETADYLEAHLGAADAETAAALRSAIAALRDEPPETAEDAGLVILADLPRQDAADIDWPTLEARLADLFGDDKPATAALLFAGAVAERGRWSALAPYFDALVAFATPDAVRLAAHVAHFTRPPADLLALLSDHSRVFPGGALPPLLRRMQSLALRETGDLPGALDVAERLAVETQTREDRLNLVQLHLGAGSVSAALPWIRRALDAGQLTPGDAVRFCAAVTGQDHDFARELWRFAIKAGVPDHLVINAYSHGFALGLDREVGPLARRMHERALSGAGDVFILDNVEDVVDHVLRRRDERERVLSFVEAGALPIQLAAGALDSLARIYRLDRRNQAGPLHALYIRHGGRPVGFRPDAPWKDWRILLDITGLLLADQLDLLRFLEALDEPVRISPRLVDGLYQLRDQAAAGQPSYVEAARAILDALDDRRLRLVEAEPIPETSVVQHAREGVAGPSGPTPEMIAETLRRLDAAPGDDAAPLPVEPNSRLVFADDILSDLAVEGLLDAVLLRFQCRITEAEAKALRARLRAAADQTELAARFDRLRERVARGLQQGRYVTVSTHAEDGDDAEDETDAAAQGGFSVFAGGLVDLLKTPGLENGVLWADDRYVSGFTNAQGNVVVGVLEVLNALRDAKVLTEAERRQRLLTLRGAGALFIPMEPDDIMAALNVALVRQGQLVETPDLAVLRRSFALGVLADRHLKIGESENPQLSGRPDEIQYLFAMRALVETCLVSVWRDPKASLVQRKARSDWLWTNLRMSYGLRSPNGVDEAAFGLAALLLAGSLANVTAIILPTAEQTLERQREYLDWLGVTAVDPAADDAAFLDIVAEQFRDLMEVDRSRRKPKTLEALRQVRQLQTDMLPPAIRERVLQDPAYAAFVGIEMQAIQTIGDAQFPLVPFWRAIVRALRQGRATVTTQGGARVRLTEQDGALHCAGGFQAVLREPMFQVLRLQGAARTAAALAWADRLDLSPWALETFRSELAGARTDADWAHAMNAASETSVIQHYNRLAQALRGPRAPNNGDFGPPPARAMLHHLRAADPAGGDIAARAAAAWPVLKAKIGPSFAFRRLAALPVDLGVVLAADPEVPAVLEEMSKAPTPMMRWHLARAAARRGQPDVAQSHVAGLVEGTATEGELFCTLLSWTEAAYLSDPDWPGLSVAERLTVVWAHAERLTAALLETEPKDWADVRAYFDKNPLHRTVGQVLAVDPEYARDCAAPDHLTARGLLYHGLAYVFPDEDAWAAVPEPQQPLLAALLLADEDGALIPNLSVLIRRSDMPNALAGFLDQAPGNLFAPEIAPASVRAARIETALAGIEADAAAEFSWAVLAAFGKTGLQALDAARLNAVFDATPMATLAAASRGIALCHVALAVRRRQSPGFPDEQLWDRVRQIGEILAERHPTPAAVETPDGRRDLNQAVEFLGVCAGASDAPQALDRLQTGAVVLAAAWPAAAPLLAGTVDNIARHSGALLGQVLWRGFITLQTFP